MPAIGRFRLRQGDVHWRLSFSARVECFVQVHRHPPVQPAHEAQAGCLARAAAELQVCYSGASYWKQPLLARVS
jgi:hypothetical protein